MKISLAMIVKNEEKHIEACIRSVLPYVDEIVIVDTGSTDRTKEIVRSFPVRLETFDWNGDFSAARNYSISLTTGDWILVLDADETITGFQKELWIQTLKEPYIGAIEVTNKISIDGIETSSSHHTSRLFPRGCFFSGRIHEQVVSEPMLPIHKVPLSVYHVGYYQTNKSDRNISLLLQALEEEPGNAYYHYQIGKEYRGLQEYKKWLEHCRLFYKYKKGLGHYEKSAVVEYLHAITHNKQWKEGEKIIKKEKNSLFDFVSFQYGCGLFYMSFVNENKSHSQKDIKQIEQHFLRCVELGERNNKEGIEGAGSFIALYNLGDYYEVIGKKQKAKTYYEQSAMYGFAPAIEKLQN